MGMLLTFSPRTPRTVSAPSGAATGTGQVLLFTGVRYERAAGAETVKPARGTRRKRKG